MKIGYLMQAGVPDVFEKPLSGPAIHVKHVFSELIQLGHQVHLLAFLKNRIWITDDFENYEPICIRQLDRGLFRLVEKGTRRIQSELQLPYFALFESLRFAQACCQELTDCDLYYERLGWMGFGGGIAAHRMGIPFILEINGDHLSEMEMLGIAPQGLQRQISIFLVKRAILGASHLVATGEGWRQRALERWGFRPEKISVIENGSEIVSLLPRDQLRAFMPFDKDSNKITVIYIGAFEPWHGVSILLKATGKAIAKGLNIHLVLVGSGSQYGELENLLDELEIRKSVTMTGHLTPRHFAMYLAGADIGVSPYCGRVEYSGLKLLDYKAAGLAILASGKDGQPAVIEHGRTGWIVPPCDTDALCDAIVNLSVNVDLRRKLGQEARLEAERFHTWRHTTQKLTDLFTRVTA
jgi:glycosyltransferase involved in cell wall biosynthesis